MSETCNFCGKVRTPFYLHLMEDHGYDVETARAIAQYVFATPKEAPPPER